MKCIDMRASTLDVKLSVFYCQASNVEQAQFASRIGLRRRGIGSYERASVRRAMPLSRQVIFVAWHVAWGVATFVVVAMCVIRCTDCRAGAQVGRVLRMSSAAIMLPAAAEQQMRQQHERGDVRNGKLHVRLQAGTTN